MANGEVISHLSGHPAWEELRKLAAEKREQTFDRVAKDLIRGEPIVDTDVAFTRGFFKGMKFLLDNPTLEDAKLRRALEESERKEVSTVA